MSEQIVDLRSVWAILRRHTRALAVAAVVGGVAGGAALQTMPSEYTSSTLVLFPAVQPGAGASVTSHAIDTQLQIATSDTVLGRAGQTLRPPLGAADMVDRISVESPTQDVLTITARGATAAEAEQLATAVADADIDYLQQAASSLSGDERAAMAKRKSVLGASLDAVQGELATTTERLQREVPSSPAAKADATTLAQLTARQADLVLQVDAIDKQLATSSSNQPGGGPRLIGAASPGQTQPAVLRGTLFVGLGAACALLLGAALAILRGRREKSLRARDQIADSIGIPVVASVQCRPPRSVAGWVSLLGSYAPGSTDAWALHQLLQRFTPDAGTGVQSSTGRRGRGQQDSPRRSSRLLVLTLDGDQQALPFGPQLASFAAANGRRTRLVTASQRQESTNALRAACSRFGDQQPRPGLLVVVDHPADALDHGDLVVQCLTVSRQQPGTLLAHVDDVATLLVVSAGAATAEELARVALAADDAGTPLQGIVVANPDPLDRTTGRLPAERAVLAPLPSLMTGVTEHGEPGVGNVLGRKR